MHSLTQQNHTHDQHFLALLMFICEGEVKGIGRKREGFKPERLTSLPPLISPTACPFFENLQLKQ